MHEAEFGTIQQRPHEIIHGEFRVARSVEVRGTVGDFFCGWALGQDGEICQCDSTFGVGLRKQAVGKIERQPTVAQAANTCRPAG
jgi:hypothetical protein